MQARPGAMLTDMRHYVRVTRADSRGYVEFEYAIGDPDLTLEMILPRAAFEEFCTRTRAERLPPAVAVSDDGGRAREGEEHDVD